MKLLLPILVVISFYTSTVFAVQNLTQAKLAVIDYYEKGQYEKDVSKVTLAAEKYLLDRVKHNPTQQKLAIILDIDDTVISNYAENKARDFSNATHQIEQSYLLASSPAIKPVQHLYFLALKEHVAVFFVTFRPEKFRLATLKNLSREGYTEFSNIYFPNKAQMAEGSARYRLNIRKRIAAAGYRIILNLGDQSGDTMGAYADKSFTIPNPLYTIAPNACAKMSA